jgi:hypothetical protein
MWEDAVRRLNAAVSDRNLDLARAPGSRVLKLTENDPPEAGRLRSLSIYPTQGAKNVNPELRLRLDAEGLVEVIWRVDGGGIGNSFPVESLAGEAGALVDSLCARAGWI